MNTYVTGPCGFQAINLDDQSPDDLEAISRVLEDLGGYARVRARAMRQRLRGDINTALQSEVACDRRYKDLPDWAKW